jgi:sarcosine oxidase
MIYDAIVIGLGIHGSSALAHLAESFSDDGKLLGIEQYGPGTHAFGSSHGKSRIIRKAYFEDPSYVPLLSRAFQLWRELETEIDQELLIQCGGLMIGDPDSEVIRGTLHSVETHQLPHVVLSAEDIRNRYPAFNVSNSDVGILEHEAGYV